MCITTQQQSLIDLVEDELVHDAEDNSPDILRQSLYYNNDDFIQLLKGKSNVMKILSLNCQSLNAKIDEIRLFLDILNENSCHIEILCLQETWLSDSSDVSHLQIEGYNLISRGKSCSAHGGVAIFVSENFDYNVLPIHSYSNSWDGLFLEITWKNTNSMNNKTLIVGSVYRPPRNRVENYRNFIEEFNEITCNLQSSSKEVIIGGDFNLDLLKINEISHIHDYFETLYSNGFIPKITFPTRFSNRNGTLIDNIFAKLTDNSMDTTAGVLLNQISDHQSCFLSLDYLNINRKSSKFIQVNRNDHNSLFNFKCEVSNQCTLDKFNLDIQGNPSHNFSILNNIIMSAIKKHLPSKIVRYNKYKHKKTKWVTDGIIRSIKMRDQLYAELKNLDITDNEFDRRKETLREYNRILKLSIRNAKKLYYHSCFNKYRDDVKKTWQTINNLIKSKETDNDKKASIIIDDIELFDENEIADKFNNFFVHIGSNLANNINCPPNRSFHDYLRNHTEFQFNFVNVSEESVTKIIKELKPKTSCDITGLSNKLLKHIDCEIIKPLTVIINQCINTGIFPNDLKVAKVIPLFKKGDPKLMDNYRPVSLLPCISKVMEKVMHMQIYSYLDTNKLLYTSQYGFRKHHSTEFATLELVDRLILQMDKNKVPLNVYLDLSKAFDTLDHSILLDKLRYYGFTENSMKLMESYIRDRQQCVLFQNAYSDRLNITTGVPQGSVLGPLLFLIYMNDIVHSSCCFHPVIYADDTTLNTTLNFLSQDNEIDDELLNRELNEIYIWLQLNKLSLNIGKTKAMVFHSPQKKIRSPKLKFDNFEIDIVDKFNFLGIVLDKHLNWNEHLGSVRKKISKISGVICRLKHFLPQNILLTLYNSLVLPHLNYGILIWGHKAQKLMNIQKKLVRIITNSRYNSHTDPLFKRLNILKANHLCALHELNFCYKMQHNLLPFYFVNSFFTRHNDTHRYNTRNARNFQLPQVKHEFAKYCIRYRLPMLYNNTPSIIIDKINTHSQQSFKRYVKMYYLNNYDSVCNIRNCFICSNY